MAAADHAEGRVTPAVADRAKVSDIIGAAEAPFGRGAGESPYAVQQDLQKTMQELVGIIRTQSELDQALAELDKLDERASRLSVQGGRAYNPGWNLATDLPSMLTVSRLVTKGAIERKESRGGHTRDDFPSADAEMGKVNFVQRLGPDGSYTITPEPIPVMPPELQSLFEEESH